MARAPRLAYSAQGKEPHPNVNIQAQIEALEGLSAVDADLREINEELRRERDALTQKREHLDELDAKLARDRQSFEGMERMRNDLMLEVRQMSQQVERSREKLGRCRTEREANAAQREIEEIRKIYRDREIEIEKLVGLLEQAHVEIDNTSAKRETLGAELGSTEGAVTGRLGELEEQVTAKEEARKSLVGAVQPVLYRRYELIRKRRGKAIAFTTSGDAASAGMCSECHIILPPMMFQKLMRAEDFEQCPSCNRILYFRQPVTETQADATSSSP